MTTSEVVDAPSSSTETTMRAAVIRAVGTPFVIEQIPRPVVHPDDVLVEVRACGLVPNFETILSENLPPVLTRPAFPAVYGLDAAGVIVGKGSRVHGVEIGDRVYVNPMRGCGNCRYCRVGQKEGCDYFALNGYLGSGIKSAKLMADHPLGGFTEYITAPPSSLVHLPDSVSFEAAARWGYMGTGYAALRRANVGQGTTLLVNGASGTLGLGTVLFALALGVSKILGVGRKSELLERVRALDPERIHVHSSETEGSVTEWAQSLTDGTGPDVVIDALPTGAPVEAFLESFAALGRCGTLVNVGGVIDDVPINVFSLFNKGQSILGSYWFTTEQGQEMADLAGAGLVRLDALDHHVFDIAEISSALTTASQHPGGFSNVVVRPSIS